MLHGTAESTRLGNHKIKVDFEEWLDTQTKVTYARAYLIGLQAGVANMHQDAIYESLGELIQTLSKGEYYV